MFLPEVEYGCWEWLGVSKHRGAPGVSSWPWYLLQGRRDQKTTLTAKAVKVSTPKLTDGLLLNLGTLDLKTEVTSDPRIAAASYCPGPGPFTYMSIQRTTLSLYVVAAGVGFRLTILNWGALRVLFTRDLN